MRDLNVFSRNPNATVRNLCMVRKSSGMRCLAAIGKASFLARFYCQCRDMKVEPKGYLKLGMLVWCVGGQ